MADTDSIEFDFNEGSEPTSIDTLRGHCKVKSIGGSYLAEFKTNGGKGSGPQRVALTELQAFRATLRERVEAGEAETVEAGYIPAPVQLARSFRLVTNPQTPDKAGNIPFEGRDWYEWNSSTGQGNASKGSKPAKVPVNEMEEFMALFDSRVDAIIAKATNAGILSVEEPEVEEDEAEVDLNDID